MSASPRKHNRPHTVIALMAVSAVWLCDGHSKEMAAVPPPDELAMIMASSTGNLPALKALLSKGMELDHQDFTGNTPLIYAARYAGLDLVQYLLCLRRIIP